ncbi:MAG: TetR/AcrR family transcriptional regulator [Pseudomonadota bacterium]
MTAAPRRNSARTRERILATAKQLLCEGDGDFEMSWVAKAAEVSAGLAYHHFGSKEGLLSAVVNDFYDRVEDSVLMAPLSDIEDWEARERARTQRYIEFLVEDPLASAVILRMSGTPAVAAVDAERWQALIETGARNMAEGQSRGVISNPSDPKTLAAMALGAVRTAVICELCKSKPKAPPELADTIWFFVRRGLGIQEVA